jgi:uncharacterized peroxidase-related enzyme
MLKLKPLTIDEVSDRGTKELLQATQRRAGFIPNMQGIMSNSPAAIGLYAHGNKLLSRSSLTPEEQTVVFMTASRANDCSYCLAAHSAGAKVGEDIARSLRAGIAIDSNPRLEALRVFVNRLVEKNGRLTPDETNEFLNAGFEDRQVLDVLTALAMKLLTNYIGHLVDVPVDERFAGYPPPNY